MAASYPASLPVKDPAGANLSTNPHSTLHDDMYDEIVAIATELGTTPKGTYASVKARLDALPRGRVAYASTVNAQAGIITVTDLTGLTATWTAVPSRYYRISAEAAFTSTVGNDQAALVITTSTNSQVQVGRVVGLSSSVAAKATASVVLTGLSGSVTYKLRAARSAGSGSITSDAGPGAPAFIFVEDIGV